ncbi:MAG: exonuclease SbcCD subunit D C-terminal domain-containing protein [Cytophagales bacterium]|nr:exonuclease SbcCD subunit D C-terminal domain-containing protein [Cytophagales bacterium]
MKILHTADWHLGKRLHGHELYEDQQTFLNWLLAFLQEEEIDHLIVAGDIFDTAYPSLQAQEMYSNFLADAYKAEYPRQVIAVEGNHDGRSTLRVPKQLLKALNTTVVCEIFEDKSEHLIPVHDEKGELGAYVVAVPFLRDQDLRKARLQDGEEERAEAIKNGIARYYEEVALAVKQANRENKPVIATGHLFAQGASINPEESERPIQMGHQAGVESSVFSEIFDYVALGHIHKAQKLTAKTDVRYSGSPYPLSFSERNYEHKMWVLEIGENRIQSVEPAEVPSFRKLAQLKGTLDEVKEKAEKLAQKKSHFPNLVEVLVTEENYDPMLRGKIDEWKNAWQESQTHSRIAKYTIAFLNKSETAAELYGEKMISQEEFTARRIFEDRLSQEVKLDEAEKLKIREAFEQLSERTVQEFQPS